MKPLTAAEILNLYEYERVREARRRAVIELKRVRRVALGRYLSFVFENRDSLWHRVFGTALGSRIEIGAIGPGERRAFALSRPGTYAILCGLHSAELGYLVVAPHRAFAQPDSLGRFALPALPPGRYELAMWDPARGSRRLWLDLPAGRDAYFDLAF